MLLPATVGKRLPPRETRPWSANGGRGELSHYALDDRHGGGAGAAGRFGRVVPAANQLQVSTSGVKRLIHRLRKRYTALLREEVGLTVSDPAEIDEEFHALCDALVASEGRLGP